MHKKKLGLRELVKIYQKHPAINAIAKLISAKETGNIEIKGLYGSALSLVICNLYEMADGNLMVVMPDKDEAAYLYGDLEQFNLREKLLFLPSSFRRDLFNPGDYKKAEGNIILRNRVIESFNQRDKSLIISYPEALLEKEANTAVHQLSSFSINKGEKISTSFLSEFLFEYGFNRSDFVFGPGDFSIRGSIIDVFSFSDEDPYRIDFFGDEVDSIRTFEVMSQLSKKNLDRITIHPNVNKIAKPSEKTSFFDLLPADTIIWFKDLNYFIERNKLQYKRVMEDLESTAENLSAEGINDFSDPSESISKILSFRLLLSGNPIGTKISHTVQFNISRQPEFNKNFNLIAETIQGASGRFLFQFYPVRKSNPA